jgi:hypothetical protein
MGYILQKQADNNSVRTQPYLMKSHIKHSTIMTQPYCQVRNHIFNPMYSELRVIANHCRIAIFFMKSIIEFKVSSPMIIQNLSKETRLTVKGSNTDFDIGVWDCQLRSVFFQGLSFYSSSCFTFIFNCLL